MSLTGACVPCLASCGSCVGGNPGNCSSCARGYYLHDATTCFSCPLNCDNCTNISCTVCSQGYYLTPQGNCASNCQYPCATCSVSDANICNSCLLGFTLNSEGICVPQTNCSAASPCQTCPFGWTLSNNTCLKCSQQNCTRCSL